MRPFDHKSWSRGGQAPCRDFSHAKTTQRTTAMRNERQFRAIRLALQQLLSDDAPRIAVKGEERMTIWFRSLVIQPFTIW